MRQSLLGITLGHDIPGRDIISDRSTISIADLRAGSPLASETIEQVRGRCILIATETQLPTVLALLELDGVARRIVLATPDLAPHLSGLIELGQVDIILTDAAFAPTLTRLGLPLIQMPIAVTACREFETQPEVDTEWVLLTSGTTGRPKMVVHTLPSLSGPLNDGVSIPDGVRWSTFYDVRRYGGLQILLRALIGGGSIVLSSASEPVSDFMGRLQRSNVTHISGTPSHWRNALLSPFSGLVSPAYVRLSGEIADQAILNRLRAQYPNANIAHAFAATEAGVGFDVRDGLAGFPVSFIPHPNDNQTMTMKLVDGTLWLRSSRVANRYLGADLPRSDDGFIDTGDLVERRGDRFYFRGRREGVINVGGQKVYPEEIEDIITRHPDVIMARVWSRKNPITGAVVAADVVLRAPNDPQATATIINSMKSACQSALPRHKVPATWHRVEKIEMSASGKLSRGA
ncbi:ANL family adenylate-forming protein [Rhodopila sp.]|uniref:ANL family adenylate-forming protein n=1 Tax=Rhodopila sp. TaxID=2480087 RepID=UPI003D105B8F